MPLQQIKTDTICSRLKELSAGTSEGQQSNGGAGQQSKEMVGSYTDACTSTVASSLADQVSHNNKQLNVQQKHQIQSTSGLAGMC